MIIPPRIQDQLIELSQEKKIFLEGNILKVIEYDGRESFEKYIETCKEKDKDTRAKRLEVTKQVQTQNRELKDKAQELEQKAQENDTLMLDLKGALELAEGAKASAENNLDIMQKKSQFELIGNIVQVALWVIAGTGIVVTGMYVFAMTTLSSETTLIGNAWSNLFGILLTNSFSIIGTIMGVKYASDKSDKNQNP